MDRINTWCRRTILSLVLLWPLQASAGSPEVERLAKEAARHADHTTVLIVGVTHDNERLADELLELLTLLRAKVEVDCLFVEYATDLQDEFDRAVEERDVVRVVEAFYLSSKPLFLTAFGSFGYNSDAQQTHIARVLESNVREIPKHAPINRELLTYLRESKISLLPYDSHSRSKEMFDSVVFEIRRSWRSLEDNIPEPNADMRAAVVKSLDARNSIMADNIISKFASRQCNKAVVVVCADHVAPKGNIEWHYGIELDTYTPLQDRLREKGLPGERVGWLRGQGKP